MTLIDQLSWNEFLKESKKKKIITKVKPFNRLIAYSKNFFAIAGYGSFTKGYILLITKDFIPSFGLIESEMMDEVSFWIELLKKNSKETYDKNIAIFEHGMCACVGGLDRAHLHLMSLDQNTTQDTLRRSIDKTLNNRKAGIKSILFQNYKLENIHDINQFMEENEEKDYEVEGKLLEFNDLKNLKEEEWPQVTLSHITKGGHYVYFKSDYLNASFLTTQNFQTQFGREVIFENEIQLSKSLRTQVDKLKANNPILEAWKWQNYLFEENILETVNSARKTLKNLNSKFKKEYLKYSIKTI